jgi:hypothetical protein
MADDIEAIIRQHALGGEEPIVEEVDDEEIEE